ncbi:MAG TPA: RDD family protein [Microlunatus sp.]|nr:RDD family protein [Microlunatus sp.]
MPGTTRSTTGLPPGVHLGPTGPRLLAALVEVGPVWLLTAMAVLFVFVLDGRAIIAALFALLAVAWAILVWAQRAARAAGPGMRLDSLQIVGFHDGRPIGWGRVLLRWLVFAGLTVSVVGLIAMAVAMGRHPRRQGWHDLVADAVVIKERPLAPRKKPAVTRSKAPAVSDRAAAPAGNRTAARPVSQTPAAGSAPSSSPAPAASRDLSPAPAPASSAALSPSTARSSSTALSSSTARSSSQAHSSSTAPTSSTASSPASPSSVPALAAGEEVSTPEPGRTEFEWRLRLDDGREIGVDGLVLLGRNPQPRVGEEDATLLKVSDEGRTVSKSHLAVGVDAGGLYVMDRGSTNGTTVTSPDGGRRPCPPGDLIDVPSGSVISFGDHWLEVHRPGHR